jgi:NAD(P)-dependent dehydrogenase (short-subunit alcohol dehydrogenase family)
MVIPAGLSTDGYENHFAINHLGHALLTKRLLALLERTADTGVDVRVIYTTSLGWKNGGLDFDRLNTTMESAVLGRWIRYSNSKLANMLHAREIARRHPKLLSFSVHPGAIDTALISDLKFSDRVFVKTTMYGQFISLEQGTFNHLWAVSAPRDSIQPGGFYEPAGVSSSEELAKTKAERFGKQLWEHTEKALAKSLSGVAALVGSLAIGSSMVC